MSAIRTLVHARATDRKVLDTLIERLAAMVGGNADLSRTVGTFIDAVRNGGDTALVRHMRTFSDPEFESAALRVDPRTLESAARAMATPLRQALERAISHVRQYQAHIAPTAPAETTIDDAQLGMRVQPVPSAGLLVPGGRAAYPSSLVMVAVPAQVAGVERLCVASPPPDQDRRSAGRGIAPAVLATAHLLGIDEVYCLGGAHAVAALALGTETIEAVDFIAGPGNAYVQEAKRQVFGTVGIDGLYGPSEVAILADETVSPTWIAADILAQTEHEPGAALLITASPTVAAAVSDELERQLADRERRVVIERSLNELSALVVVADLQEGCELLDRVAPEHAVLAVADPRAALGRIHNAGAYFLGATPVAGGDYYAGPSHCLPTGSTARFSSGCSVFTFLRRASICDYPHGMDRQAITDIATLAEAEELEAHASSVRVRSD